jgi:hypothetical protein
MPFPFFFLIFLLAGSSRFFHRVNATPIDATVILRYISVAKKLVFRLLVRRFVFSGDKRIRAASVVRRKKGPRDNNQWFCVRNTWTRTVVSATERRKKRQSEEMSSQHPPIPVNCSNLDSGTVP